MVLYLITFEFGVILVFQVNGGCLDHLRSELGNHLLIPHDHKAVAVEVTPGHLMLLRAVTLPRKYDNINEVAELLKTRIGLAQGTEQTDVTRVAAGVLGDHNVT